MTKIFIAVIILAKLQKPHLEKGERNPLFENSQEKSVCI